MLADWDNRLFRAVRPPTRKNIDFRRYLGSDERDLHTKKVHFNRTKKIDHAVVDTLGGRRAGNRLRIYTDLSLRSICLHLQPTTL